MTVYETLFGTPEKAARSLGAMVLDATDLCYLVDALSEEREELRVRCMSCPYKYDRYGCEQRGMTLLECLRSEVSK